MPDEVGAASFRPPEHLISPRSGCLAVPARPAPFARAVSPSPIPQHLVHAMSGWPGPAQPGGDAADLLQLLSAIGRVGQDVRGVPGPALGAVAHSAQPSVAASSAFHAYQRGPPSNGTDVLSALQFWSEVRAGASRAPAAPQPDVPALGTFCPEGRRAPTAAREQVASREQADPGRASPWRLCRRPAVPPPRSPTAHGLRPPSDLISVPTPSPCCSSTRSHRTG